MKRLLSLFACCYISLSLFAQTGSYWEEAKSPYGGGWFDIVKTVSGRLYATGSPEQVYRSDDNGLTWDRLPPFGGSFPDSMTQLLSVGRAGTLFMTLFVSNITRCYKSTDEGQSWTLLNNITSVIETDNGTLIGGNNGNVTFRSTDGGQTWAQIFNFGAYVHLSPFGELWMYFFNQLYRSQDNGSTWTITDLPTGSPFNNWCLIPSGTILAERNDSLLRSTDGGQSFSPTSLSGLKNLTYTVLSSGRILLQKAEYSANYVASDLLYSDDDGLSWQVLATPAQGSGGKLSPIGQLSDGTIFKDYYDVLLRSNDGGQTWQVSGTGIRSATVEDMKFVSDSFYFALNRIGLWKTENAGETWKLVTRNDLVTKFNQQNFDLSPSGGLAVFQDRRLLWSSDYGETFTDITPATSDLQTFPYVFINPYDNTIFTNYYLATNNYGIKKSTNSGQTWTVSNNGDWVHSMAFHPSGRIIANCLTSVLISDNGGTTWSNVPNPEGWSDSGPIASVAPNGAVYLSREDLTLWRSYDAGSTWTKLPPVLSQAIIRQESMAIAANGHLVLTDGYEDVVMSIDDGDTWQTISSDFPAQYVFNLAISPSQKLFAGVWGKVPSLFKSRSSLLEGAYIEGNVRIDADADCTTNDAQTPIKNRTIEATGVDFSYYGKTNDVGHYQLFVDTGAYDVKVQNPNSIWWTYCDTLQQVNLPALFQTDTADFPAIPLSFCPLMTVKVAIPGLRRCFDNFVYVAYCNQGTEPADSAWIDVNLDPYLTLIASVQPYMALTGNTFRFFVGNVPSGECGLFQLMVHVDCDSTVLGQTHCVTAHGFPDTLCTTVPNWSGANIVATASCQDTILQMNVRNNGDAPSQPLHYIIIEDDVVLFSGQHSYQIGESLTFNYPANGSTWRIESDQEPNHPFSHLALAFAEGCGGYGSLGFINQFPVNGIEPAWHRACVQNSGSFDPNDKQGFPLGTGAKHSIRPGQKLEYLIRFQNTGTDTAFTVVVRDTLSGLLDPLSLQVGASSHLNTWNLSGEGILSFTFSNIELPDSNTNEIASHGFVQFSIAPRANTPLGSVIENEAAIFFDFNLPVITNSTWHTIEESPLTTAIRPVPKQKDTGLEIWPNPFSDKTFIRYEKKTPGVYTLKIFDSLGRLMTQKAVHNPEIEFDGGQLPRGLYWAELYDAQGRVVGKGKMVRH